MHNDDFLKPKPAPSPVTANNGADAISSETPPSYTAHARPAAAPETNKSFESLQHLRAEISRAVVGQHDVIDQVLACLLAGGHVLLEGVPGLGKTLLVRALAKTLDGDFSRCQFTPDLMPSDITGHAMFDSEAADADADGFRIRKGPVFCNFLLADEINRAPAKTQAALLEVMQERQVTIEGTAHKLAAPFMVLATQNPIELEGTYPLPEAQLDRFLLNVRIDYPLADNEEKLVRQVADGALGDSLPVEHLNVVLSNDQLTSLQQATANLRLDDAVLQYAVSIVRKTRQWPGLRVGAGPRGSIGLVRAARAWAMLAGRDFVIPDDVKSAALPVLRHRLQLTPELEMDGTSTDLVLQQIIDATEAPRQ